MAKQAVKKNWDALLMYAPNDCSNIKKSVFVEMKSINI